MVEEKIWLIYLVTNLVNGKIYVGQTSHTLAFRWIHHRSSAKLDKKTLLHRAMRKYGESEFSMKEIGREN